MEWIKCSERMPEDAVEVLVWFSYHGNPARYELAVHEDGGWTVFSVLGRNFDDDYVSHWCPLTQPE